MELDPDPLSVVELRGSELGERWLASNLAATRVRAVTADELQVSLDWTRAALAERPALPPVGVVVDIGALALGATLRYGAPLPVDDHELVDAVRAYDDQVLGRLAADARLEEVGTALARLEPARVPAAIALLVDGILRQIGFRGGIAFGPGAVRQLERRAADEVLELGAVALRDNDPPLTLLARGYRQLVAAARSSGALITDALVFQLGHFDQLATGGQRLAVDQIVGAAGMFERELPRRVRRRSHRSATVATTVEDESQFPAGGFAEVSTSGSLENLVASELIYLEPGARDRGEFDLFDVRFVENELLFYTRDESVHTRPRRCVALALMPGLARARFKDAELPYQRLVLALGMIYAMTGRLVSWLAEEALHVDLLWVADDEGTQPLADERQLCEVLFEQWRGKGVCELIDIASPADAFAHADERARQAVTDLIWVDMADAPAYDQESYRPLQVHVVDLTLPAPRLVGPAADAFGTIDEQPWAAWRHVTKALATGMV